MELEPIEKAKELMQKAYDLDKFNKTPKSQCKIIALFCTSELLASVPYMNNTPAQVRERMYYMDVRTELNNL